MSNIKTGFYVPLWKAVAVIGGGVALVVLLGGEFNNSASDERYKLKSTEYHSGTDQPKSITYQSQIDTCIEKTEFYNLQNVLIDEKLEWVCPHNE